MFNMQNIMESEVRILLRKLKTAFLFLGVILISTIIASCAPQDATSEQLMCENAGGSWEEFSDACADRCYRYRDSTIFCAQAITEGCDCGTNLCWNGTACIPIIDGAEVPAINNTE